MAEDSPQDVGPSDLGPSPDLGRAKREPPTIDLEATEISGETRKAAGEAPPESANSEPASPPASAPISAPISPWVIAPVSGAVAAALVIGVAWMLGWPTPAPQANMTAIDDLTTRVAGVESKTAKPALPATDPAVGARIEALDKSLAALRGELTNVRTQSEKLAATVNDGKAAPRGSSPPDIADVNARISALERTIRAEIAKLADAQPERASEAGPADDALLRRVVTASLLDISVRQGDPYTAILAAAKTLAPKPEALKPLESFAASGVPTANVLSRELLMLVPKLSPRTPESTAGIEPGIVERLQEGASKLIRIERTDAVGNDRGAIIARVTAAALRNNSAEARRELNTLAPADRTAAQQWIDKADARDAALAASRQFAVDAMADLAKPAQ